MTTPTPNSVDIDSIRNEELSFNSSLNTTDVEDPKAKRNASARKCLGITAVLCGLVFAGMSIAFGEVLPSTINAKVMAGGKICNEDDLKAAEQKYVDPYGDCETCVPYYYSYYAFNVTNAMEVLENSRAGQSDENRVKVSVQELGPYVYRKRSIKTQVKFDGEKVSYKSYNKWEFNEAMSCATCKTSDRVTALDYGYLRVMAATGGEKNFADGVLTSITKISIKPLNDRLRLGMLKAINGLNSQNPQAMAMSLKYFKTLMSPRVFKIGEVVANMTSIHFEGLFTERTIQEFAMGTTSFLLGMAAESKGKAVCPKIEEKCNECILNPEKDAAGCMTVRAGCAKCKPYYTMKQLTVPVLCPRLNKKLALEVGQGMADMITDATCDRCVKDGKFCLIPLPGAVEGTGMDFNEEGVLQEDLLPVSIYYFIV